MFKFNQLIKEKRAAKGETIEQLAKALKCSPSFARHIESSRIVPVSPRLITGLSKHFRIPLKKLEGLAKKRNAVGKKYMREWARNAA